MRADAASDSEATPELLAAAQAGDAVAFDRLVAPLHHEIHNHCYRMLASLHDAEDITQETLVRAWKGLGTFQDRGSFRAWLFTIATNRCLTALQQRSRRALPADFGAEAPPLAETAWLEPYPELYLRSDAQDPAASYLVRESVELAFVALLQHLPPGERAALVLRGVLGFTAQETADILDLSAAAVNSSLQRARLHLKERLPAKSQQASQQALTGDGLRQVADQYTRAWEAGDVSAIVSMLTEDATYSMPPLEAWYAGRRSIAEFLIDGPLEHRWRLLPTQANGQLAFGTYLWDADHEVYVPAGLDVVSLRGHEFAEVVSFLAADFAAFDLPASLPASG